MEFHVTLPAGVKNICMKIGGGVPFALGGNTDRLLEHGSPWS